MIAYLNGTVLAIHPDNIIVDVHGVGYEVYVGHPYEHTIDEAIKLHIYHHIREDISALYGFSTIEEKQLYQRLLSVKGVGPKVGMTILASSTTNMLIHAIETEDISYLRKIPGIGPKAAGQIILDLKGKLAESTEVALAPNMSEAIEALTALGYTKKETDYALKDVVVEDSTVEDIVRQALKKIMG